MIQRLRSRQQFQAVLAGAPVAKTPHFALHRLALDTVDEGVRLFPVSGPWLGVLLPKRWARRAVTRSAKRACSASRWASFSWGVWRVFTM